MKKYLEIFKTELKVSLTYRSDLILSAVFSGVRILLVYILWSAVFSNGQTIEGMNLKEMVTYYLIGLIITPVTQGEGLLYDFAWEVRDGKYAKYIVRPMSPLHYFMAGSIGRQVVPTLVNVVVFGVVIALFSQFFAAVSLVGVLMASATCIAAMFINIFISYIISASAFKFTEIAGFHVTIKVVKILLSGSLIPLNMMFGEKIAMFIPFAYTSYFPAMQCLGKTQVPFYIAITSLLLWCAIFYALAKRIEHIAPRYFEGVGI